MLSAEAQRLHAGSLDTIGNDQNIPRLQDLVEPAVEDGLDDDAYAQFFGEFANEAGF